LPRLSQWQPYVYFFQRYQTWQSIVRQKWSYEALWFWSLQASWLHKFISYKWKWSTRWWKFEGIHGCWWTLSRSWWKALEKSPWTTTTLADKQEKIGIQLNHRFQILQLCHSLCLQFDSRVSLMNTFTNFCRRNYSDIT